MLDVLPYDFLPYSLEMVSLTEPGVRLVAGQRAPVMPLSLLLQHPEVANIHKYTCLCDMDAEDSSLPSCLQNKCSYLLPPV